MTKEEKCAELAVNSRLVIANVLNFLDIHLKIVDEKNLESRWQKYLKS